MIMQYKAHVLPIAEMNNGAIYHATTTVLKRLDNTYYSFVRELNVHQSSAFMCHNLGPLEMRRDIGMLGFLHKIVLGECHPGITALFPFASSSAYLHGDRHNRQFQVQWDKCRYQKALFGRSVLGVTCVYNRLPQSIIDSKSVQQFRHCLTQVARDKCENGEDWIGFLSPRRGHIHLIREAKG